MSATLIARNPVLQRLRDEGYAIRIHGGSSGTYLVVDQVPYVNDKRKVRRGSLVTPLELNGDQVAAPVQNHQMWIVGEHPCNQDGSINTKIQHSTADTEYGNGLVVNHGFSAKPAGGRLYRDYYEKVTQYVAILASPAQQLKPGISAQVFQPYVPEGSTSVFRYPDTATSRVGIGAAASRVAKQRVAIIGLGGTGSYVLDLVAKTHAAEIHLFDGDMFENHSAFRAPGAAPVEALTARQLKVEYFAGIYQQMRDQIVPHPYYVTDENVKELAGFDFVFICVDKPKVRKMLFEALLGLGVPFVDSGMSVQIAPNGSLMGQCRSTLATPARNDHLQRHVSYDDGPDANDLYAADIQVVELNALNAIMAVLKWKKHSGFYLDQVGEHNSVYTIGIHTLERSEP